MEPRPDPWRRRAQPSGQGVPPAGRESRPFLLAGSASLGTGGIDHELRCAGTPVAPWTAALLPEQASSPGGAWAIAAMLGGILFVAVAEIEARRDSQTPRGQFATPAAA
jgi:hypothetical protein